MARVPYVRVQDVDPTHIDLLARPINLGLALVTSNEGYRSHHVLGAWIRSGSTLDPRLRELLILQVGYASRSRYAFSHHVGLSRDAGVTDRDVRDLGRFDRGEPTGFSGAERTALTAARELTLDGDVGDATWAELAAVHPAEQLVEIVLVVGYYCHVTRLLRALRIDVEPEYLPFLEHFPTDGDQTDQDQTDDEPVS